MPKSEIRTPPCETFRWGGTKFSPGGVRIFAGGVPKMFSLEFVLRPVFRGRGGPKFWRGASAFSHPGCAPMNYDFLDLIFGPVINSQRVGNRERGINGLE